MEIKKEKNNVLDKFFRTHESIHKFVYVRRDKTITCLLIESI